ncbi:MAG TPA: Flp pilus assembly protein CpaB [Acidimicrobiia bacterium]|nr:Flp pilus assembly protein CpaB [Acidimicrobiia bacterium]
MRTLLRRPPRAVLLWGVAGLTALATAHLVATDLAALHRRARSAGPEVDVVIARRDLPLGSEVRAGDLAVVRRHRRHLPAATLASKADAVGRVVATPVLRGGFVSDRHLAPRRRTGLDGIVPPGMRAVRVEVEGSVRPRPGSVVDVLVTFDPSLVGPETEPTLAVVRGVLVVASDGEGDGSTDDLDVGMAANVGVTVLTDPEGARRLAFAATQGVLTLALAPPEDAVTPVLPPAGGGA